MHRAESLKSVTDILQEKRQTIEKVQYKGGGSNGKVWKS